VFPPNSSPSLAFLQFENESKEIVMKLNIPAKKDYAFVLGEADYQVIDVQFKEQNKNGDAMIILKLKVTDENDSTRTVYDGLTLNDKGATKVHAFGASIGMVDEFDALEIDTDELI
jgi:hypothetical protein